MIGCFPKSFFWQRTRPCKPRRLSFFRLRCLACEPFVCAWVTRSVARSILARLSTVWVHLSRFEWRHHPFANLALHRQACKLSTLMSAGDVIWICRTLLHFFLSLALL